MSMPPCWYMARKSSAKMPLILRIRWQNGLAFVRNILFTVSHVYMVGNACADGLVNIRLTSPFNTLVWFHYTLNSIRGEYIRNMMELPNYRFVNFWEGLGLVPFFFSVLLLFWMNAEWCTLHHSFFGVCINVFICQKIGRNLKEYHIIDKFISSYFNISSLVNNYKKSFVRNELLENDISR